MNDFIDIYCERTGPGLWDEPLNALSNAAFFIAAFFALRRAQREGVLNAETGFLILLLLTIGLGSTAFHTLATQAAMLADTLPILLFQVFFLIFYCHRVIWIGWGRTVPLLACFTASIGMSDTLPGEMLNGSEAYIPPLAFLAGLAFYHWQARKPARYALPAAVLVFAVSLTFRTLDMAICPVLPIGVHYIWHMLNGLVLYLCLYALIANTGSARR